jgi:hypothetical protein
MQIRSRLARPAAACLLVTLACAASTAGVASGASTPAPAPPVLKLPASAVLEQCVTAVEQSERSVTFAGEMTAVPGTARMQMRIELQERTPKELVFHQVADPGLGSWLRAAPGVHTYKNLSRVINLSAPAEYRGEIRFRWLNARGHAIKELSLRTGRCREPAPPPRAA